MTAQKIHELNIEAGGCKTDETNAQSIAAVVIHSINDPNTKSINERTECNFQCKEGYFDKDKGDEKILFKCVPDPDRKKPTGQKETAPTGCQGA